MNSNFDWGYWLSRFILLTFGAAIGAFAITLFYIPSDFAPNGVSGIGVILNELFGISVGLVIIIANIPILILSYIMLNKNKRLLFETIYTIIVYTIALDLIAPMISTEGLSDNILLNAIFGGIMAGVGSGMVYRAGGSMGGTSTLAKVLRSKFSLSISMSSIYTDSLIILASGFVFGWESALYATLALFIGRTASDYVLEGVDDSYTAIIVSQHPIEIVSAIGATIERGATQIQGTGHSGKEKSVLFVTISRSQINALLKIIKLVDEDAFVSVLKGYQTYGKGFQSIHPNLPLKIDAVDDDMTDAISTQQIKEVTQG